jgi:protein-L-isoaspartate(D-aspartate) O-methyltransferase
MRPEFSSNWKLVDYLVRQNRITSKRVEKAFRKVDRGDFVPENFSEKTYVDRPLPLNGETISAPHMLAIAIEMLELDGNENFVEIGSGSGYQAAILGNLSEKVTGIEINEELAEFSREKVPENVEIRPGSGFEEVNGKFDRILFSCATESFGKALEFVRDEGIIVGPVKEDSMQILKKWKSGKISGHRRVRYVEMQD